MSAAPHNEDVFLKIRSLVARIADDSTLDVESIDLGTSLVEDLGIDSLRFVDLTLSIEDTFGFEEYPIQQWADEEAMREGRRYTVGALTRHVAGLLEQRAT